MDFDQNIHAKRMGRILKFGGQCVFKGRHDQEDAISPKCAGLGHLIGVNHEILAKRRKIHSSTRSDQIAVITLEIRRIGQYRQAARPARLIGLGQFRRIEIGANKSL